MRHLPHCRTFVTGHHGDAWVVLAEMAAFVKSKGRKATIVSVSLDMSDDASYYGTVVVER